MYENCNYFKDKLSISRCLFLDADTLVLALYFVVAIIIYIYIHQKIQSNKFECSKRGKSFADITVYFNCDCLSQKISTTARKRLESL